MTADEYNRRLNEWHSDVFMVHSAFKWALDRSIQNQEIPDGLECALRVFDVRFNELLERLPFPE